MRILIVSSPFLFAGSIWEKNAFGSAFRPTVLTSHHPSTNSVVLRSSLGNGPPPPPGDDKSQWSEFFDPKEESENMMKAREYMNENSLPISYDQESSSPVEEDDTAEPQNPIADEEDESTALISLTANDFTGGLTPEKLAKNPYMQVVSKLAPSDLIAKFSSTAHPRVQNAVRNTILGLIGGLPKMAFDTTAVTTGQKLASLMFQLQMTGYMFKNADYRLSVEQSLDVDLLMSSDQFLLPKSNNGKEEERIDPLAGKVKGKLRVHMPSEDSNATMVDAAAYMSELRSEVSKLRDELVVSKKEKEEAVRKDLLMYIRTLPKQELESLTNTMSHDVLVGMKGLVNAVLSGLGEGQIGPDTVTEQSGEAMAQLCMWQLVIGYNLRTLEVREEMRKSLSGANDTDEEGVSLEPGTLQ